MKRKLEVMRVLPDEEMDGVSVNDNEVLLILEFSEKKMAIGSEFMLMLGCDLELTKLKLLQVFFYGKEMLEIPVGIRVVCKFRLSGSKESLKDSLLLDERGYLSQDENGKGVYILPLKIV